MICVVNKMIKHLLQMVNTREDIFKQQIYVLIFTLRMFTTFKQLVCNLINNTYHIRRRFISLLTNIQTTSLQFVKQLSGIEVKHEGISTFSSDVFANKRPPIRVS